MSTGIATSFAIGGLLLLSILFLNLNMSQSSTSLTLRQITQQNIQATSQILTHDFSKIGFDQYKNIDDPIIAADSNRIVFKSNIDDSSATETVEWFYNTSAPVSSSANPDDYSLQRSIDGLTTDINVGITAFKMTFLDENSTVIPTPISTQSDRNRIRQITVEATVSSKEQLGKIGSDDGETIHSTWTKTFSPKNIN
jgi:hypothetical protein